MNHRLNQEKYREKLEKNKNKFKNKKEENWKEETKKSTKYKKVDQKSYERAEKNLKQENCKGEVKTTKNSVYICNKCTMSSERNTAIQCTRCKQWYHDKCFKCCFALSLKSNYLYCFKGIIVLYRNTGIFLAFHHSKNLEILPQDWNTSGELSLQSFVFLDDEKLKTFKDTVKTS